VHTQFIENNCNRQNPGIIQIRYWYGVVQDEIFASSAFRVVMTGKLDPCGGGTGGAGGLVDNTFTYTLIQGNGIWIDPDNKITEVGEWEKFEARDQDTNQPVDVTWSVVEGNAEHVILSASNDTGQPSGVALGVNELKSSVWFKSSAYGSFTIQGVRTLENESNQDSSSFESTATVHVGNVLKVTDERTKDDSVPYTAYSPAGNTQNKELCLRANPSTDPATIKEDATILMDIPGMTDAAARDLYTWKVLELPAGEEVDSGVFPANTPASITLSLKVGETTTVADEKLFQVQIGKTDGEGVFNPEQQLNVRLVRDRLNYWFEPLSADVGWRTAKPEPRADTHDYRTKHSVINICLCDGA